jgi:hypothetical protein
MGGAGSVAAVTPVGFVYDEISVPFMCAPIGNA